MDTVNGHSPQEIARLLTRVGLAKARLGWIEYILKAFMGGVFISLGGLTTLTVVGGSSGLRESDPGLATMVGGFMFPLGFVLIVSPISHSQSIAAGVQSTIVQCLLAMAENLNMFVMPFTLLQRQTSFWDLAKNWLITYVGNLAGCLFTAGFLAWWTDTFTTASAQAYLVTQADGRVNIGWGVNFLRGIGCNLFVALAMFLSLGSVEFVSKIYAIWIPIWTFVILGYQHCIANFFMVPIGMFYGAHFGVGKFIYQSVIPVTLGNILAGVLSGALFWYLYGRNDGVDSSTGQPLEAEKDMGQESMESDPTVMAGDPATGREFRGNYDRSHMSEAA